GDSFGESVSISGGTVVVGAPMDDLIAGGVDAGSAYVFVRGGASWSQQAKLRASDAAPNVEFGACTAIAGDSVLVGAPSDTNPAGLFAGAAYVLVREGTTWSQQAKLIASDARPLDRFGTSVSIQGDTAVVGTLAQGTGQGAAYVFVRVGAAWVEQAKLVAVDFESYDLFGHGVSVDDETILIGSPHDNSHGSLAGSAHAFRRVGSTWQPIMELLPGRETDHREAGTSVSSDGGFAIVGAPFTSAYGEHAPGVAYVYRQDAEDELTLDLETEDDLHTPLIKRAAHRHGVRIPRRALEHGLEPGTVRVRFRSARPERPVPGS
ncbi:MAG: FG-GAP repeat protein, partial [Actinobacteria bacterium]|nr:FG-GAP repeat protein [Actinomycetota bacterium]